MDEELKINLQQAHQDETNDITKYESLINMTKDPHIRGVLTDILHDEESHKEVLEMLLKYCE